MPFPQRDYKEKVARQFFEAGGSAGDSTQLDLDALPEELTRPFNKDEIKKDITSRYKVRFETFND